MEAEEEVVEAGAAACNERPDEPCWSNYRASPRLFQGDAHLILQIMLNYPISDFNRYGSFFRLNKKEYAHFLFNYF